MPVRASTSCGALISAEVAAPPSPVEPAVPVPAIVLALPVTASSLRMRLPVVSATYRSPFGATVTPDGALRVADVAALPSPVEPAVPVPNTRVITPLLSTLRILLPAPSAM